MTNKIGIKAFIENAGAQIDKGANVGRIQSKVQDRMLYVKWYTKHYTEIQTGKLSTKNYNPAEKGLDQVVVHKSIQQVYDRFQKKVDAANSWTRYLPFAGLAAGAATGIFSRLTDTGILHSFGEKSRDLCRNAFSSTPVLRVLNGLKQKEITRASLAAPLIPVALKIIYDLIRTASFKETAKNITFRQVMAIALIGVGMYCNKVTSEMFDSFDASGHMMLKTLLANALSVGVHQAIQQASPAVRATATALSAAYAASDAVLVHNTVHACHTVAESAAGVGLGLSLLGIARA